MTYLLRGALALLSAVFLATAIRIQPQAYAVALLVPSIGLAALAALGGSWDTTIPADRLYRVVTRITMVLGIFFFATSLKALVEPERALELAAWLLLSVTVGAAAFGMLVERVGSKASVAFFVLYSVAIAWVLVSSPGNEPYIDVIQFQQGAAKAIYEGANPYAIRFLDMYGARSSLFYGVGVSMEGVLNFGFPYLPLSLVLILPFDWLLSDFRIAHAVAIVGGGVLMARMTSNAQSRGAAAAFLLTAPILYVLKFGWTEPLVALMAITTIYLRVHRRRGVSLLAGLLVSVKQYAVLFLPSTLLLLDRPWRLRQVMTHFATVGMVVASTTLPFFLWNPEAFIRSTVELQLLQPFRADSIAFPAIFASYFGEPNRIVSIVVPLMVVVLVTVVTLMRTPTGAQGFALASGLTLMVAFAFSKQAFDNYYLLVMALLFGAAATGGVDGIDEGEDNHESLPASKKLGE